MGIEVAVYRIAPSRFDGSVTTYLGDQEQVVAVADQIAQAGIAQDLGR